MEHVPGFAVRVATEADIAFAQTICDEMADSAKVRGTGIAKRQPDYLAKKMREGKAVIAFALDGPGGAEGSWAGFCYIESWQHDEFVANSGLIVAPAYRKAGVAKAIKARIFRLSRLRYPQAKIFGLTTGLAVMKINSELGYEPVTYSELTTDEAFWAGCQSCVNFDILTSKGRKNCLCTAMLFDPAEHAATTAGSAPASPARPGRRPRFQDKPKVYERWMRLKLHAFLKARPHDEKPKGGRIPYVPKAWFHLFTVCCALWLS